MNNILGKPYVDFSSIYHLGDRPRRSGYGYVCTEKATGIKYICHLVKKDYEHDSMERARRFVEIWQHMSMKQHPNILELKAVYEDARYVYLVMQMCSRDDLSDWLFDNINRKEPDEVAYLFWQVVNAVHAFHSMGVMLRKMDLQTFWFLPEHQGELLIKAVIYEDGETVFINEATCVNGDAIENYGKEIDIWAAGAILFKLLTNLTLKYSKAKDHTQDELDNLINEKLSSKFDAAKDLLKKMLKIDPKKRITTAEALEHPWFKYVNVTFPDFEQFKKGRRFSAMVEVLTKTLSEEENKCLKQVLNNMYAFGSTMTSEELKYVLFPLASRVLSESKIEELHAAVVEFCGIEFITNIMHRHKVEKENIHKAFMFLDKDGDGFITRDDLGQVMAPYRIMGEAAMDEIIDDIDTDKDRRIHYGEFEAMIQKEMQDYDEKQRMLKF